MNSAKWTLSILLATCCTLPATAEILVTQKSARDLSKSPLQLSQHEKTTKTKRLNKKIERQVTQAQAAQQNAVPPGTLSEAEYQEAEIKLQQLQNAWDPESFEPFPTFENHPELLQGVTQPAQDAPKQQLQQPQPCNCNTDTELNEEELYQAEAALQHIRDTQDPNATFETYPQLLLKQCGCKGQPKVAK